MTLSHHNATFIAIPRTVGCFCGAMADPIPCMGSHFFPSQKAARLTPCPKFECIFLGFQFALSQFKGRLAQLSAGSMVTIEELGVNLQKCIDHLICKKLDAKGTFPPGYKLLSHGQADRIGRMSINWSPAGQYLIPIPNHPGVKLAESTHHPPFTRILSPLTDVKSGKM